MADETTPKDQPKPPEPKPAAEKPAAHRRSRQAGWHAATAKPAPPPAAPASPPARPRSRGNRRWWPISSERFGSGVREASTYMGQNYMVVDASVVYRCCRSCATTKSFDYCVDITAVHYPKRDEQFDMVWILYSFPRNERMRVKTLIKDGAAAPSVVAHLAHGQLAGARSVRHVRHRVRRPSRPAAHPAARTAGRATRCARTTASCSRTRSG